MTLERRSEQACFGGRIGFYGHRSDSTRSDMRFGIYLPPQAGRGKVPALYYLAGLTCTEETFMIKAGALRLASEYGLALVACDTSPRGLNLPGDSEAWDFGVGAGFYLDATAAPWSTNYRMGVVGFLGIRWAVTAHWLLHCAIPRAGIRFQRLRQFPIRWRCLGARRHSATTWEPTLPSGRTGMHPC
jgi:S-formylglutathione hydrolase